MITTTHGAHYCQTGGALEARTTKTPSKLQQDNGKDVLTRTRTMLAFHRLVPVGPSFSATAKFGRFRGNTHVLCAFSRRASARTSRRLRTISHFSRQASPPASHSGFSLRRHLSWANYLVRFGCSEVCDLAQTLLSLLPSLKSPTRAHMRPLPSWFGERCAQPLI